MANTNPFEGQVISLALAAFWPVVAIGLVVASWIGDLIPPSTRARIARRGPKEPFKAERLEQARR
ncbi:MAG: hypothetical protein JO233_08300 [Candidatus Eremiobacteraeota bacterium]|nr:hypothetical protein [Candidatus Eremiobacteraeota bacterium]